MYMYVYIHVQLLKYSNSVANVYISDAALPLFLVEQKESAKFRSSYPIVGHCNLQSNQRQQWL